MYMYICGFSLGKESQVHSFVAANYKYVFSYILEFEG